MKISAPVSIANSVAGNSSATSVVPEKQKIAMRTNASPEYYEPDSTIQDTNSTNASQEVTKPLSPQYAALAKQRRALQVKERELADREKAITSDPSRNDGQDIITRLKSQPLSVLQEHGVTYDQLTEAILATQGNAEINALKAEILALKEGVDKNFTDRDHQAEQQVLAEMRKEAAQLAREGDTFEMVRETNSLPDVMQLIERTYRTTGEVLDVQEAMQLVEDELVSESLKIANIRKVQSRMSRPAPQPQQQRGMHTLTNRDTSATQMSAKARAIAAFHGTLKK